MDNNNSNNMNDFFLSEASAEAEKVEVDKEAARTEQLLMRILHLTMSSHHGALCSSCSASRNDGFNVMNSNNCDGLMAISTSLRGFTTHHHDDIEDVSEANRQVVDMIRQLHRRLQEIEQHQLPAERQESTKKSPLSQKASFLGKRQCDIETTAPVDDLASPDYDPSCGVISSDASTQEAMSAPIAASPSNNNNTWAQRYDELIQFRKIHMHCLVPHNYKQNVPLAQWVKRQRNQKKLKQRGEHCNLTDAREHALNEIGFVWDAHSVSWQERWNELLEFRAQYGHCNVPSTYPENPKLAIWVKCQRRQMKLWKKNKKKTVSSLAIKRYKELEAIGFDWNPRNLGSLARKK